MSHTVPGSQELYQGQNSVTRLHQFPITVIKRGPGTYQHLWLLRKVNYKVSRSFQKDRVTKCPKRRKLPNLPFSRKGKLQPIIVTDFNKILKINNCIIKNVSSVYLHNKMNSYSHETLRILHLKKYIVLEQPSTNV